jgi:hypothetical protein
MRLPSASYVLDERQLLQSRNAAQNPNRGETNRRRKLALWPDFANLGLKAYTSTGFNVGEYDLIAEGYASERVDQTGVTEAATLASSIPHGSFVLDRSRYWVWQRYTNHPCLTEWGAPSHRPR